MKSSLAIHELGTIIPRPTHYTFGSVGHDGIDSFYSTKGKGSSPGCRGLSMPVSSIAASEFRRGGRNFGGCRFSAGRTRNSIEGYWAWISSQGKV